ncbi:hypothetical protein M3Y95_00886500 [Aphelenchoides besseyi]|nr:hypothetical protein M3Y95_00886500 [Aphelenchoides besseyi]
MGVHGLWPIIEQTAKPVALDALEGKRLAVDISLWLHQAAQGYSAHGLNSKSPHLALLMHRIAKLLFYKIRPIFVFDGENIPALKKQVLRERALKRHMDELTLNKRQKALLERLAKQQVEGNVNEEEREALATQVQMKFAQQHRDDVYEQATTSALPTVKQSTHNDDGNPNDYLSGYNQLLKEDERINFLLDAKERAKADRVDPEEIPKDSLEFSHFQLQRLCKRNAINVELEKLKQEKAAQVGQVATDLKNDSGDADVVIVDSHSHGHILRRAVETERGESQKKPLSNEWEGFLDKIRAQYGGTDESNSEGEEQNDTVGSGGFSYGRLLQRFAQREAIGLRASTYTSCEKSEDEMKEVIKKAKKCEQRVLSRPMNKNVRMEVDEQEEQNTNEKSHTDTWTPEQSIHGSEDEMVEDEEKAETSSSSSSLDDNDFVEVSDNEEMLQAIVQSHAEQNGRSSKPKRIQSKPTTQRTKQTTQKKTKSPKRSAPLKTFRSTNFNSKSSMPSTSVLPRPDADDENAWMAVGVEESGQTSMPPRVSGVSTVGDEIADSGVYAECQRLLSTLGLPFMVAPAEAEAQCVCLERLGLCDGIVTDDSDVWLFGGERVYRNMFNRREQVHEYDGGKIYDELGLARLDFVALAMLAGGDYTRGFDGVGCVTALELLGEVAQVSGDANQRKVENTNDAYAEGLQRLQRIRLWLDSKPKEEDKKDKPTFFESKPKIRLRRLIESRNDVERIQTFPSDEVYEAYMKPLVDPDNDRFTWNPVEFVSVHEYVWTQLGWSAEELRKHTHDALRIWDAFLRQPTQHYQTRLTAYLRRPDYGPSTSRPFAQTSRVQDALKRMKKKRQGKRKGGAAKPENEESAQENEEEDETLTTLVDRAKRESRTRSMIKQPMVSAALAATSKFPSTSSTTNNKDNQSYAEACGLTTIKRKAPQAKPAKQQGVIKVQRISGPQLSESSSSDND